MSVFMYPIYQSQCFTDKICCLKKYLVLCLFGAFRIDGNGLSVMGSKGYIILFQWFIPRFQPVSYTHLRP